MAKGKAVRQSGGSKSKFGPNRTGQRAPRKSPADKSSKLSNFKKDGQRAESSGKRVLLANPRKKFGRNKRHANPDVSDDDSLPSESDEADSDLETASRKTKKQKTRKGDDEDNSDSDVEQFLNEEEEDEPVKEVTKAGDSSSEEEEEEAEEDEQDEEIATDTKRVTTSMVTEWRASIQVCKYKTNTV